MRFVWRISVQDICFPNVYNLTFQIRTDLQSNSNFISVVEVTNVTGIGGLSGHISYSWIGWDWTPGVVNSHLNSFEVGYTLLGLLSKQIVKR